jgi:integrase
LQPLITRFGLEDFTDEELVRIDQALSDNTRRGYESDFNEWTQWCTAHAIAPLPIDPVMFCKYIHQLSKHGAANGTISRRFSALRFAESTAGLPTMLQDSRVLRMWDGIRRTNGRPPDRSVPIMPPLLWEILDATPIINPDGTPCVGGLRDHVLFLVGFTGALRRSEISGIDVEHLERHEHGMVLHIPTSKMNQTGEEQELVALPYSQTPGRCPIAAIDAWRQATAIDNGPLLRGLTKHGKARAGRIGESSINTIVKTAIARTGTDPSKYSAHGLRAGFITYANMMRVPDRDIARQSRHSSLASLDGYIRINELWTANGAVALRI